ncbi:MAG: branched-chain amino acid aminotransferase [Imperialibacter sp.]|uniref:branched-chain amino acid aminotransferase n=1 Tax=Imperialibacter sp. TaxID=2038411 RepID=UPI0032EDFCBA
MIDTLQFPITQVAKSRIKELDMDNVQFGKSYSDHMFMAEYVDGQWTDLRIVPYGNLSMSPANTTLHYGQSIFEGMKAYKADNGDVLIFRPDKNAARLNKSAVRMCIPEIPEEMFMSALTELLKLDRDWVPNKPGTSLYIRPFVFGNDPFVGIRSSLTYQFIIFTSPAGAYYSRPVKVKVETKYTRAAPGGTGSAKTAGNYAAALYPMVQGQKAGYDQLLWTNAGTHEYFEESGTMNVFFLIDGVLCTAPAGETILDGVTRDSVITLAKEWGYPVEERKVYVKELKQALLDGKVNEAFGVGTAATIAKISHIGFEDGDLELPGEESRTLSNRLLKTLDDIKYGKVEDTHGWIYRI